MNDVKLATDQEFVTLAGVTMSWNRIMGERPALTALVRMLLIFAREVVFSRATHIIGFMPRPDPSSPHIGISLP